MTDFKKLFKQYWRLGLLAVIAIVLITIISAMSGDVRHPGSTYNIAPNGYSSWYQMMVDRGIKIQRWQKSFPQLTKNPAYAQGTTLLQVNSKLEGLQLTQIEQEWVRQGNTMVILGVTAPAEEIPFQADLESAEGMVRIETTRRFRSNLAIGQLSKDPVKDSILADRSGSIITQFKLDKGRVIIAITPYLAANAYQNFRPNYELLAELVSKDRQQVLVDEYIHGYVDRRSKIVPKNGDSGSEVESDDDASTGDTFDYLARTPLIIVFVNLLLGLLVLVWQQNRRFGKVVIPKSPEIDNSEAYIQALGGVLRQANSSEFVLQNVGRAEQLSWQQKLGLGGERLVADQTLITAWEDRVRLPTDDLRFVLQLTSEARRLTPTEFSLWLIKLRTIDRQLNQI
jgi:Domain of unknown function (DUF4350)